MFANLHGPGVIFCPVEDVYLTVANDCCWIEGVERLPMNGGSEYRISEGRSRTRSYDRIAICWARERADLPCGRTLRLERVRDEQCRRDDHHAIKFHAV